MKDAYLRRTCRAHVGQASGSNSPSAGVPGNNDVCVNKISRQSGGSSTTTRLCSRASSSLSGFRCWSRANRPYSAKDDGDRGAMYTKLSSSSKAGLELSSSPPLSTSSERLKERALLAGQIVLLLTVITQFMMLYRSFALLAACGLSDAALMKKAASSDASAQPFQTYPEEYAGTVELYS